MSAAITEAVWQHTDLTGNDKTVLLALAWWCDEDGYVRKSIADIADRVGLKERATQRILKDLAEGGYITIDWRKGRGNWNDYRVCIKGAPCDRSSELKGAPENVSFEDNGTERVHDGAPKAEEKVHDGAPPLIPGSPNTSHQVVTTSRRKPKPDSPELTEAVTLWQREGLGHISQSAKGNLRVLIATHGIELVRRGITASARQSIKWPISWMRATLPAWEREERNGRLPEGLDRPNPQRPGALRGSAPAPSGRLTDAEREALARRGF